MKKLIFSIVSSCVLSTTCFAGGHAVAIPQNASGKVGQTINVNTMFQYNMTNDTSSWQNYSGVEKIEVNGRKTETPLSFTLPPHGSKNANDLRTLKYPANAKGKFTVKSTIAIAGNPGAGHSANSTLTVD